MDRREVAATLAMIASLDGRRSFGDLDVTAWAAVIGDLRFDDARDAVLGHYRRTTESLMPATLIAEVKRIRRDRIGQLTAPIPSWIPSDDARTALEWERDWYRAVGDGLTPEAATEATDRHYRASHVLTTTEET